MFNDDIYVVLSLPLVQSGEAAAHGAGGEGEGEHAGGRQQDQPPRLRLLHQLFKGKNHRLFFSMDDQLWFFKIKSKEQIHIDKWYLYKSLEAV